MEAGSGRVGVGDIQEEAGQPRPGAELSARTAGGRRFDSDPQPGYAHQGSLGGKGGWGPSRQGVVGEGLHGGHAGRRGCHRLCRCVRSLPTVVTAREPSCPPPVVTRWPVPACVPGSLSMFHAAPVGLTVTNGVFVQRCLCLHVRNFRLLKTCCFVSN